MHAGHAAFYPLSETPAAAVVERGVRPRRHLVDDGAPLVAYQPEAQQEAQVNSRRWSLIWRRLTVWEAPARVEPARRGKDVAKDVILAEDVFHRTCRGRRPNPTRCVHARGITALQLARRRPLSQLSAPEQTLQEG